MRKAGLRVLFVTSELFPLVKTGGLGDVSAGLPSALVELGVDVRILLPGYRSVRAQLRGQRQVAALPAGLFPAARLLSARAPAGGVRLLVLDCPSLFDRDGGPYQNGGADWPDNYIRFALLSQAAARLGSRDSPLQWRPHVIHCNDWQAGLAPAYVRFQPGERPATIQTIHNLAFQGIFPAETRHELGLPEESFSINGAEYYGNLSFLKAGLYYADRITTVSPNYAKEIQDEPLGMGLQGLLATRAGDLSGILNGIDTAAWNPATDPYLPQHYEATHLEGKATNKRALQQRFSLPPHADTPVFGLVSRLTHQKGIDLVLAIADEVVALPAQIVALGSGDHAHEEALRALAAQFPNHVGVHVGFDEAISHLITAGADVFLMPSRFEPCGLNQMYCQRYGTPPIVHATGGLVDSVVDASPDALADGSASGFLFFEPQPAALREAVQRSVAAWRSPAIWRSLQRAGARRDFSWQTSAKRYVEVYESALARHASQP